MPIINLKDERCECEECDLALEFVEYAKMAETEEQLFNILRGLVDEAKDLAKKEILIEQIAEKAKELDVLMHGCDCEERCCDECDCEDCEL